jgi:hypothetical protein
MPVLDGSIVQLLPGAKAVSVLRTVSGARTLLARRAAEKLGSPCAGGCWGGAVLVLAVAAGACAALVGPEGHRPRSGSVVVCHKARNG